MADPLERFYTPAWMGRALTKRLRRHLPRRSHVLEPCAGPGYLARELRAAGWLVTTGDLDPSVAVDRRWDFPEAVALDHVEPFDAVITNPPFSLTVPMAQAGLAVAPLVSLLLPLPQLEAASGRGAVLQGAGLWRVTVLPRGEFIYPKGVKRPSMEWVSEQEKAKLMGQEDLVDLCRCKPRTQTQPQQTSLVGGARQ